MLCVEERVKELKVVDKQFNYGKELCVLGVKKHFLNAPSYNPIIIRNNATNGDVIKALYPNRTFFNEDSCCVTMKEYGKTEEDAEYLTYIDFDGDWWGAPYKGGK